EKLHGELTRNSAHQEQLIKDTDDLAKKETALKEKLSSWMSDYNVKFETTLDEQELMELLAYDQDWIESERASLLAMEDAVKHAKAILQERSKLLATHTQQRLSESTLEELTTLRFEVKES